jgi:malonate-semialdehyde dehydrogenase (acetylating)/methylmalonate-semialdehyde dehydrogenase
MAKQLHHWIGGQRVAGASDRQGQVFDPATGDVTGVVPLADPADVDHAVRTATRAAHAWATTSLSRRSEVLFAFRELLNANRDALAAVITAEHGKTRSDAGGEIARGLENVEFACGIPALLKGGYTQHAATEIDVHSMREPLGVVTGITPFNFPAMVPLWMFPNAIACGNAFILKPSEKDPSPSLFLAELLQQAGLPDGVFNVIHGDAVAVGALLAHPGVAAASFVGSTPIARSIYETGTSAGKRVQALGGAKNHMVVLPDADIDVAADAAVSAGFGSAGERCMAVSVLVAVGAAAEPLLSAIEARVARITVGPGDDPTSEMGPLVTEAHRDKVRGYLDTASEFGADVRVDGRRATVPDRGFFLGPSVLDRVKPGTPCYDDEIFGPVLSVVRVDTFDEAVALINSNPYGNGTAIFTRDGGAARRFQNAVNVGMIGVNVAIPVPVAAYSFGGWKASLFGDRHIYGPEGIDFYTRTKVVTTRWPDPATSRVDLGFPQSR